MEDFGNGGKSKELKSMQAHTTSLHCREFHKISVKLKTPVKEPFFFFFFLRRPIKEPEWLILLSEGPKL